MTKRLLLSVVCASLVVGAGIGYYRGLPNDFVPETSSGGGVQDYGYQCGDGSEFTLVPNAELTKIRIVPASGVGFFEETVLVHVPSDSVTFGGGDVRLVVSGTGVTLLVEGHASTSCVSMRSAGQSLFGN